MAPNKIIGHTFNIIGVTYTPIQTGATYNIIGPTFKSLGGTYNIIGVTYTPKLGLTDGYIYLSVHTPLVLGLSEGISIEQSVAKSINLYLDEDTREVFTQEANSVGLSFSAYLRVVARAFSAWSKSQVDTPMSELRKRIQEIIIEESRKV